MIILLVYLASQTLLGGDAKEKTLTYAEVQRLVGSHPERVDKVIFRPGERKVVVDLDNGTKVSARYPITQSQVELERLIVRKGVAGDSKSSGSSAWWTILTSLLPFVLLFGFWVFLVNRRRDRAPNEDITPDVTNG